MKKSVSFILFLGLLAWACNNESTTGSPAAATPAQTAPPAATEVPAVQTATSGADSSKPAPKSAIPSFMMKNARNQDINLASLQGKKIFVNLWATWCPPCRAEIPSIESLAKKTDRNKVEFVLLSLDDNFSKAINYASANGMQLPVYYPGGTLPPLFVTEGIPVTFIFNEQGEIVFQQMGSMNYDTEQFVNLLK